MGRVLMIGRDGALLEALRGCNELDGHDVQLCLATSDALQALRQHGCDVLLTNPEAPIEDGLAVARDAAAIRPGVPVIALSPDATSDGIIAAMRANVFACFTGPFDAGAIADMVRTAARAPEWRDGIEVVSGLPHWLTLRVTCHMVTVERLVRFMTELQQAIVPDREHDLLIAAFRELLLNAMEHGAGFDPDTTIEVTAAKTARAIVYHFRDPGPGFDADDLAHAARSESPEDVLATAMERAARGLRPGGFGMLIARQIADELVYNERRNEVLMVKHLD
ncbi:MAG TPA: ATP-binding protein [Vicinamibacterales bacterium]